MTERKIRNWNGVPDRPGWHYGLGVRGEDGILTIQVYGPEQSRFEVRAQYQTDLNGPGTGYDSLAQAEIDRRGQPQPKRLPMEVTGDVYAIVSEMDRLFSDPRTNVADIGIVVWRHWPVLRARLMEEAPK